MTARTGTQHWRTAQWFTKRCTHHCYEGLRQPDGSEYPTPGSIEEAVGACGLHLVRWDGGNMRKLTFDGQKVAALLIPAEAKLSEATGDRASHIDEATRAMEEAAQDIEGLSNTTAPANRGEYLQITTGISHGIGRRCPMNIRSPSKTVAEATAKLLSNAAVQNIAASSSKFMKAFAPALYRRYERALSSVCTHDATLQRNFEHSVFATATFNLGPRVCTRPHRDYHNLPGGFCAITALGKFDPTLGGHLILWELNLVVEFPPGTTIMIPSAVLTHSNLPVAEDETRMSFTQYSPGALFRYVDDGFRLRADIEQYASAMEKQALSERDRARAPEAWDEFPNVAS